MMNGIFELYFLSTLIWASTFILWVHRVYIFWRNGLRIPIWARIITTFCALATTINVIRLIFGVTLLSTRIVLAIWCVVGAMFLIGTIYSIIKYSK